MEKKRSLSAQHCHPGLALSPCFYAHQRLSLPLFFPSFLRDPDSYLTQNPNLNLQLRTSLRPFSSSRKCRPLLSKRFDIAPLSTYLAISAANAHLRISTQVHVKKESVFKILGGAREQGVLIFVFRTLYRVRSLCQGLACGDCRLL